MDEEYPPEDCRDVILRHRDDSQSIGIALPYKAAQPAACVVANTFYIRNTSLCIVTA